jgi:flavodoxin I
MVRIAVIYGSTTGNTANAAETIASVIGDNASVIDVSTADSSTFSEPDVLILGTSTWGEGDLQDDWFAALDTLKATDLSGKHAAVFGLGDQESYAGTFVDAMRDLYDAAVEAGATMIGAVPDSGYDFQESRAVTAGRFVGLVIDEDNQPDLTGKRVEAWVNQLKDELGTSR